MSNVKGQLNRGVSIIGVGCTPLGDVLIHDEILNLSERELFAWASINAIEDAGIEPKDIDCTILGTAFDESQSGQISPAPMYAAWAGQRNKTVMKQDAACATGLAGLIHSSMAIASGRYDIVMSSNVDINSSVVKKAYPPHMRNRLPFDEFLSNSTTYGTDNAYWYPGGDYVSYSESGYLSFGKKYGFTLDQLANAMESALIMSRENAVNNPICLATHETFEEEAKRLGFNSAHEYLNSPYNPKIGVIQRAKTLTSICDGAAALILCPTEIAKKMGKPYIEVIGFGSAVVSGANICGHPYPMEVNAFKQAYEMAGIKDPYREVDYMGIHDCFCQHYMTVTDAAGYFKPGESVEAAVTGRIAHDGDKPVNTSGGRLNLGHPVAAAATIEIMEAVKQTRGECGKRQMKKKPETIVIQGYGGGFHTYAAVLRAH